MGKATILSNLGDGLYEVRQDIGTTEANASIASLQTSIAELDAQIITATTERNNIAGDLAAAQSIYDAAVTAYAAAVAVDPKASTKAWEAANVELVRQQQFLFNANAKLTGLQANRAQLARDLNALQNASFERNLQAWCVDYTDDATGEVATIEIPGEPKYTLIAPGARAHTAADGRTLARQVMTGPQAYFNAAILPGWQKFKPTYRRGTITALNGDVATVALADDRSSAQNLAINQASTLSGVPIVYQNCNGEVFEVGDECVVEFQGQNWSNPKVIGFQSNPKQCGWYLTSQIRIAGSTGTDFYRAQIKFNKITGQLIGDFEYESGTLASEEQVVRYADGSDAAYLLFTYRGSSVTIKTQPQNTRSFSPLGLIYDCAAKKHDGTWYVFALTRENSAAGQERLYRFNASTGASTILASFTFNVSQNGLLWRGSFLQLMPPSFNSDCTSIVSPIYGIKQTTSDYSAILFDTFLPTISIQKTGYNIYSLSGIDLSSASYANTYNDLDFISHKLYVGNSLEEFKYTNFFNVTQSGSSGPSPAPSANYSDSITSVDTASRTSSESTNYQIGAVTVIPRPSSLSMTYYRMDHYNPNYSFDIYGKTEITQTGTQTDGSFIYAVYSLTRSIYVDNQEVSTNTTQFLYEASDYFLPSMTFMPFISDGTTSYRWAFATVSLRKFMSNDYVVIYSARPSIAPGNQFKTSNTKIQTLVNQLISASSRPNANLSYLRFNISFTKAF